MNIIIEDDVIVSKETITTTTEIGNNITTKKNEIIIIKKEVVLYPPYENLTDIEFNEVDNLSNVMNILLILDNNEILHPHQLVCKIWKKDNNIVYSILFNEELNNKSKYIKVRLLYKTENAIPVSNE